MPLSMSPAPAIVSIASDSQSVSESPNTTIAAPQIATPIMIARPCRRTCFARPENSVARNEPSAGAA